MTQTHVYSGVMGNTVRHRLLGISFVAGVTVRPITHEIQGTIQSIGGNPVALTPADATDRLVAVADVAREIVAADITRLEAALADADSNLKEAAKLADLAIVGDEADTIRGMSLAAKSAIAAELSPEIEIKNAAHLSRMLPDLVDFDQKMIEIAVARLDDAHARRAALVVNLRTIAEQLDRLADAASEPVSVDRIAKIKASTKLLRIAPVALADLRKLRAEVSDFSARLESIIGQLEKAA